MREKICNYCGYRLSEFYNTGMLGCPNCYREFGASVEQTLIKIQGSVYHAGKKPKISKLDRDLISEYERLIKEKELASLEGRFNDMLRLTEEITALNRELKGRGLL